MSKAKSAGLRKNIKHETTESSESIAAPVTKTEEIVDWQVLQKSERLNKIYDAFAACAEESRKTNRAIPKDHPLRQKVDYIPDRYRSNEINEDLVLEFTENFRHNYIQLYPFRPPLLLSPMNEKFISTYIKPTELPFPLLYDSKELAKFIFHYITYEPLENPHELPTVVCSPTTTLKWQKGDSFDICTLLGSLLIGIGYNAYVVSGYARKHVTENNQRVRDYPDPVDPEEKAKEEEKVTFKPSKYKLKARPNLTSKFKREDYIYVSEKELEEREAAEEKRREEENENADTEDATELEKRIHCWILILPGARDVTSPYFIEPGTGEIRAIDDPCYISIESIWNNENYWINMNPDVEPSKLGYDLKDLQRWEFIFITENSDDDEPTLPQQGEGTGGTSVVDKEIDDVAVESGELDNDILDMPSSWVSRLVVTKQQYENKYPHNTKVIRYKNALLELFAAYHLPDLLVKRLTIFHDDNLEQVNEMHCYFKNRKDLLERRSAYYIYEPKQKPRLRVHEWFAPGRRKGTSIEALREMIEEFGYRREYRFYSEARLDGLDTRIEIFDPKDPQMAKKVIETFKYRADFLCYRSAVYDIEKPRTDVHANHSHTKKESGDDQLAQSITKMTEKFERNKDKPANEDVAKRTFYVTKRSIRLEYQYGEGKITRAAREYSKSGEFTTEAHDQYTKQPKLVETIEEFCMLIQAEKECTTAITNSHKEMILIGETRTAEENKVEYTTSIYDTVRNRPTEQEIKEMEQRERELAAKRQRKDILDNLIPEKGITSVTEAERIYNDALKGLKEQLMLRIKIIDDRLQKEKINLQRRRNNYQKNTENMDRNEEYIQFIQDTVFKINILKERAEDHNQKASRKFNELKQQLRTDPRLAPWLDKINMDR